MAAIGSKALTGILGELIPNIFGGPAAAIATGAVLAGQAIGGDPDHAPVRQVPIEQNIDPLNIDPEIEEEEEKIQNDPALAREISRLLLLFEFPPDFIYDRTLSQQQLVDMLRAKLNIVAVPEEQEQEIVGDEEDALIPQQEEAVAANIVNRRRGRFQDLQDAVQEHIRGMSLEDLMTIAGTLYTATRKQPGVDLSDETIKKIADTISARPSNTEIQQADYTEEQVTEIEELMKRDLPTTCRRVIYKDSAGKVREQVYCYGKEDQ